MSQSDCLFCRIAAGEVPADVVASDDDFVAFNDLRPLASVHVVVAPRHHVESLDDVDGLPADVRAGLLPFIAATARKLELAHSGYRVVTNTGPDAGQKVKHLHWHIIGGEPLGGMA